MLKVIQKLLLVASIAVAANPARAALGMIELSADSTSGPVTVFYQTTQPEQSIQRGVFRFEAAIDAPLVPSNRRLIVISHGSPASPWVYLDLVRTLVDSGFIVAMPEHYADNYRDDSEPGPPSWKRRPVEVSRAIDRVGMDRRFASALELDRVGMYGMSAGGHAALTLAGGRWSPSRLRRHCQDNLAEDFHACAGLSTSLSGGLFDGLKKILVQAVNNAKFDDQSWYQHGDPRITAIVAGVPFAADFDPDSLVWPTTALGLISAKADRWLVPRFHSEPVLDACKTCENLLELKTGGHGALLSPLPKDLSERVAALIGDPKEFQREIEVPKINSAIKDFFARHLLRRESK